MVDSNEVMDKHYKFLEDYFGKDYISDRFNALWYDTLNVLVFDKIERNVMVNEECFSMFIFDYFTDVWRLKKFHDIETTNFIKVYAYEFYWFVRRRPIQIINEFENSYNINEKVAIGVFLPRILEEAGLKEYKNIDSEFREKMFDFIELLLYNITYRHFNAQSLELMVESFLCGCKLGENKDNYLE